MSVHNENINSFIATNFTSENLWLGATRINNTTFQWDDGSAWDYSNWNPNEPNNQDGGESCILTNWFNTGQGGWNDVTCQELGQTICQRPPTLIEASG